MIRSRPSGKGLAGSSRPLCLLGLWDAAAGAESPLALRRIRCARRTRISFQTIHRPAARSFCEPLDNFSAEPGGVGRVINAVVADVPHWLRWSWNALARDGAARGVNGGDAVDAPFVVAGAEVELGLVFL